MYTTISKVSVVTERFTYNVILFSCLLLQHHDPVVGLVQGAGEPLPLALQRVQPPLQVHLPLSHQVDLEKTI